MSISSSSHRDVVGLQPITTSAIIEAGTAAQRQLDHGAAQIWKPADDLVVLARTVRASLAGAKQAGATLLDHLLAVGDALLAAKTKAGTGHWLAWLKRECDLSEDSAERYMRLARGRAHLDSARVRNLSLTGALRLIKEAEQTAPPPPRTPRSRSTKPPKTTSDFYAFSFVMSWWQSASVTDRRRLFNSAGSRAVVEALPPSWGMRLVRDDYEELESEVAALKLLANET